MSSDDSDDEPLSSFVSNKEKQNSEIEIIPIYNDSKKTFKKKEKTKKSSDLTIEIAKAVTSRIVERPTDVWMYLKDLNRVGPYSCLLCAEWFINKTKIVLHYIVNHKKNFCSICKYFVVDDQAWAAHQNFHKPWSCSQCPQSFPEVTDLCTHFSEIHHLVHCKLCHATVPDNEEYNTHLIKRHNTSNVTLKDELLWLFENNDFDKFKCTLCSKEKISIKQLTNHFISFHHITLKCLAPLLSGKSIDFSIKGAELTQHFIDTQLQPYARFGYVDLGDTQNCDLMKNELNVLVKQERMDEDIDDEEMCEAVEMEPSLKYVVDPDKNSNETVPDKKSNQKTFIPNKYTGDDDFDITSMEVVIIQKCYHEYIEQSIKDVSKNTVSIHAINYEDAVKDKTVDINCSLCPQNYTTLNTFVSHTTKMHCVKMQPTFSCRVCVAPFDSSNELDQHIKQELGEFEDLWICQFCDKEFDNRVDTRKHLIEHWNVLEYDNCFSPHLGFKCKYCPVLFWNEGDREKHHLNTHLENNKQDFYKCSTCDEVFSDKVWFTHHYLEKHQEPYSPVPIYIVKCCLCGLCLPTVEDMRTHFKLNHPDAKKVFCSLGNCRHRPFSHKKSFQLHLRLHVNGSDDGRRACGVCGEQFPSARSCAAHAAQAHRLACALCRLNLATLDERKIHYLIHHPGRHPFQCDKCDKSFQYKSSLYLHKQEHSSIQQDFTCDLCGKTFKKRDSYREHCAIHTGPRHTCSYCPMEFVQRSNMLRHERRHTGERPYSCSQCNRTFADKGACTTHARTHKKGPTFSCMYCGQSFVQKSKLKYHIRRHTGENLETCPECGKLFTSLCSLREHSKVHMKKTTAPVKCPICEKLLNNEKGVIRHMRRSHVGVGDKYSCPICSKQLTSVSSLREHVMAHSDSKIYTCKICPKGFNVKRTMVRHLNRRHNIKPPNNIPKDYFTKLDPRDCNLNLDVETMNNIFGPPKPKINEVLITDYVTDARKQKEKEDTSDESDKDNVMEFDIHIKTELEKDESDHELEPTNFVSIKIESFDENDME